MSQSRDSGRHPVNIGHLVMGLAFVGVVGVWALFQSDVVEGHDIRWLLPVPWVVAGIVGLVATTLTSRDRWGTRQTGWVESPPAATDNPEDIRDDTTPESLTENDATEENR